MIASSLREGDDVVDMLLKKDADATMKSKSLFPVNIYSSFGWISESALGKVSFFDIFLPRRLQWPSQSFHAYSSDCDSCDYHYVDGSSFHSLEKQPGNRSKTTLPQSLRSHQR